MGRLLAAAIGALLGLFLVFGISIAQADQANEAGDFRLLPQTRVKVAVVEWVEAQGEYREWTALNGEYAVSKSGMIALPLVGQTVAAGLTSEELATAIADAIQRKTGLVSPPSAMVEVVRYPSVYVNGSVDRPGEFEYRPGLIVLQAVAMAGGRMRRSDPAGGYSELEQIRYAGELGRIDLELLQRRARRARLEAELADRAEVDFASALADAPFAGHAAQFAKDEDAVFRARTEAYERQLASLTELGALFRDEIQVLEEKMTAQDRQIAIAEDELSDIAKLVKSGTATRSRETGLERVVADLQSSRLDLTIASMRAQQRLSETDRDALSLKGARRTEIGTALQAVNLEIDDLTLRRGVTEQLLQATGASLGKRQDRALEQQPLRFTLIRAGAEGERQPASETTLLQPGDVLEVHLDLVGASAPPLAAAAGRQSARTSTR
ncbi:polysaccharide biosynthesis/export family protein [Nitratireductor pacificus]|uniref:Polysaccharide export protein n=1 Tax=Nitratireductor pacificus pht-3B TaxID=391937 RepID=K2M8F6_9HYPH|nr:polysaccharide biosynthesis/export family protein [Nitratireductor pacificus]EKF18456.1 polysaccharide export protein [Nitratireductor pacificus pht-3B]